MFARTARELAEDMIRICDSHLEQAWYDAPQPSSSTAVPQAASTQGVSKKRAWADVECNETPENLGMVEQSAAVGGGERPLGNLNVFQTYICRKILCDEPFLLAKGQFILDEHGDPLDPEEREEHIVVSVANVPGSIEDAVEGVVIARKCCQHYVGRNLYLLEKKNATHQRLPLPKESPVAEQEGEEWKDRTTFEASEVKHFSKNFLWPHVQECTNLQISMSRIMAAMTNAGGFALQEKEMTIADLETWLDERIDKTEDFGVRFSKHRHASESIAAETRDQHGGEMVGYVRAGGKERGHQFDRFEHRSCTVTRPH